MSPPRPAPLGRGSAAPPLRESARHHPARRERDCRVARTGRRCADHRDDGGLGVSINFWQSYRSQQAAERLRSSVTRPRPCSVTGPGSRRRCATSCRATCSGCRPATWCPRTHGCSSHAILSVQQSMLTGESLPADKTASADDTGRRTGPERAASGVSRHVGRQRHRNGGRDRDGPEDDLRRHRRAAGEPRPGNGVRARSAASSAC